MSEITGGGIRAAREQVGWTQAGLAQRAGVSRRTVTAIEAGGHVSSSSLGKVVAALASDPATPPLGQPPGAAPVPSKTVEVEGRRIKIEAKRLNDLPVVSYSTAYETVTAVRAALVQFEQGQFTAAAEIVDAMMADDRIKGVVSQRIDGLLGLNFRLEPSDEDDAFAAELAEQAGALWPRMASSSDLRELWKWGRFLGIGIAEKLYDTESRDGWVPKLKVWHPRYLYWNWTTRSFWLSTQDGPVEVREGDPHWVIYAPFGYGRAGWMEGLIRSLAIPWLFRQFGYRDWGRYNEVHGLPIRAVIEPSEWEDDEKRKALREVAKLASESVVRLPQNSDGKGFDLKLVEATARTYDSFKLGMEQANSSIAIVLLGQNLTAEVKGGAYAAAQVHERVAASIIRSDASTISDAIRGQLLAEWAVLNFGPKADGKAPRPAWDTSPPEDKKGTAEAVKTGAEAISTLRATGLPVDFAAVCERLGIPLVEGVEIPLPEDDPEDPEPDDDPDDEDPEEQRQRKALAAARADTGVIRAALSASRLGRRDRAPLQGQAYVDELAVRGRDEAARILAGDVRALKRVLAEAKPLEDGRIDAEGIKAALLAAYAEMREDDLADSLRRCILMAQLSGRYSVQKEVAAK